MTNPLQLYVLWRRPIGIWLAATALVFQAAGHIIIAVSGRESYIALALVLLLFAISLALLVMRRISAALYGTSFFIIGLYKAAEVFVYNSHVPFVYILAWCAISFVGIAGLLFNRRWFDERIIRFSTPDV